MADNYLEKKFEEHLAARGKQVKKAPASLRTIKAEHIQVYFPPRRVFVACDSLPELFASVIDAFRKADCNVAFCAADRKAGSALAQRTGARFYPVETVDAHSVRSTISQVIALWGNLDIVVTDAGNAESSVKYFEMLRKSQDTQSGYGRIIIIAPPTEAASVLAQTTTLAPHGITVNGISPAHTDIASMCIYLSLPESSIISGMYIG